MALEKSVAGERSVRALKRASLAWLVDTARLKLREAR
jgi:hypothetical protein